MNENYNVKPGEITETVSHVLDEIFDRSAPCSSSSPEPETPTTSTCTRQVHNNDEILRIEESSQQNRTEIKPTLEIYRTTRNFSDSLSDIDLRLIPPSNNVTVISHEPTRMPAVPPSYSTVIKQGRPRPSLDIRRDVRSMEVHHLSPFSRIPPPSYAEIQGDWSREMSHTSSEQILFGPDPIYMWCSRCATVVVTATHSQRSKFTHFTAVALCVFGCWPCALMPYCMNSCKNTYHYCPDCNYLFGMYRPW